MKNGFLKVGMHTPMMVVGDVKQNTDLIIETIKETEDVQIMVFPSGAIAGFTLGDGLFEKAILDGIRSSLIDIAAATKHSDAIVVLGTALEMESRLYDCAVVMYHGEILGISPKENITPELARYFVSGVYAPRVIYLGEAPIPVGVDLMYSCSNMESFKFTTCMGTDIDSKCLEAGENLVIYLSENFQIVDSQKEELNALTYLSKKSNCTIVSLNPSMDESTTDYVYSGSGYVVSCGNIIGVRKAFEPEDSKFLIDLEMGTSSRLRATNNAMCTEYDNVDFEFDLCDLDITAEELAPLYSCAPFVPSNAYVKESMCHEVVQIQVAALIKRMIAIKCTHLVVGISGGLDSTLALLVCAYACDSLGIDRKNITAVTMPCFGTSDLTYNNACNLIKGIGATFKEININDAVTVHLENIGHDIDNHNVAYENAQARERTQVLMDIANDNGAIVVGTGDLSELALGWATYNGDHMSMYSVNGDVPKTLIRAIVTTLSKEFDKDMAQTLINVVETPVSPELLPPAADGKISQKTEDKVGPYDLHDFYLYYMLKYGFSPVKIYDMAVVLFDGMFDKETILKWEKVFYKRFFASQYKRSCMPDGPKTLCIDMSPRGGLKLPSDATGAIWAAQLEKIK